MSSDNSEAVEAPTVVDDPRIESIPLDHDVRHIFSKIFDVIDLNKDGYIEKVMRSPFIMATPFIQFLYFIVYP